MKIIEMRPPRIWLALFAIAFSLHLLFPSWDTITFNAPILGMSLGLIGFCVMIGGWLTFQKHKVAICPTATTEKLITSVLYSFSRNPMYLGMTLICVGIMLFFHSLALYGATLIIFCFLNFIFIPYEEAKLIRVFGGEYSRYSERVRRWL